MAHDVNQSKRDIAAQVRSLLVDKISQDRIDLWIPPDTRWEWEDGCMRLTFSSQVACNFAKRTLQQELVNAARAAAGPSAQLIMEHCGTQSTSANPAGQSLPPSECNSSPTDSARSSGSPGPLTLSPTVRATDGERTMVQPITTAAESKATILKANARVGQPVLLPLVAHNLAMAAAGADDLTKVPAVRPIRNVWQQFVPGNCNQLAWTAANLVLKEPGSMTPVLFHGPSGVGKSHLAVGLAQQLRSSHHLRRVLHLSSEQFTNDFTEAILGKGLPMFRRKYRDLEALILDDIQFLIGKKATLGELHHTIDNLLKAGRQIVILADRSLPELEGLGPELVARIRGGLVSPLMPLDEETRFQILSQDVKRADVEVPSEFLRQIAIRMCGDGRALKGVVKRLVAMISLHGANLTWDQCWNAVFDLIQATQPIVRLKDIERVVCDVFGLDPRSLQSNCKTRTISQPRMLAMFLARKYTPAAYKEIGDYFGQRRHSTVISAEKTVETWLKDNTELQFARGPLSVRDALRHVEAHLHVG